tara:strand:- start:673 stop:795 length:123 start_codon:yes stop_codon:yes gene_type:complete
MAIKGTKGLTLDQKTEVEDESVVIFENEYLKIQIKHCPKN